MKHLIGVQNKLRIDNFVIEYNRLLNDIELLSNYINPDKVLELVKRYKLSKNDVAYILDNCYISKLDEIMVGNSNGSILGLIYFNWEDYN